MRPVFPPLRIWNRAPFGAAACRLRRATPFFGLLSGFFLGATAASAASEKLVDAPIVWYDDDQADIPQPKTRDVNVRADQFRTTIVRPMRQHLKPSNTIRRIGGDHYGPAQNVNALGEVPNSSWFTNRIGLFPMDADDVAKGPGEGDGPERGTWKIVSAKTEGISPGFVIDDSLGERYLLKFDRKQFPGIASRAGVVTGRLFHAMGYNVPDDAVVTFRREDLALGSGVKLREEGGAREMTAKDLAAILEQVPQVGPGEYLALSSKYLTGTPVGFFDFKGRRKDDPNDRIDHEDRRELRGLRIFSAWTQHFDTKQGNTLDMYVADQGRRFVKHYLIDFASTLGTGASGPAAKFGHEYGFDGVQILGRFASVGLHEDEWRKVHRPEGLEEIGAFDAEHFDPTGAKPLTPNTAFAFMSEEDGYWAAKIVSAFRREHLEAAVGSAKYADPRAAAYLVEVLEKRRDKIAREFFSKVAPLDFFRVEGHRLRGVDLGVDRGIWTAADTRYRVRTAAVDEDRKPRSGWSDWRDVELPEVELAQSGEGPFEAVTFEVARNSSRGPEVTVYVARTSGRVVAIER
jgi:hypothetical protein